MHIIKPSPTQFKMQFDIKNILNKQLAHNYLILFQKLLKILYSRPPSFIKIIIILHLAITQACKNFKPCSYFLVLASLIRLNNIPIVETAFIMNCLKGKTISPLYLYT